MLLKHKDCIDVAIDVLGSFYIKEKEEYSLRVVWVRTYRNKPPTSMNITQRIRIHKSKMADWLPINQDYRSPLTGVFHWSKHGI